MFGACREHGSCKCLEASYFDSQSCFAAPQRAALQLLNSYEIQTSAQLFKMTISRPAAMHRGDYEQLLKAWVRTAQTKSHDSGVPYLVEHQLSSLSTGQRL